MMENPMQNIILTVIACSGAWSFLTEIVRMIIGRRSGLNKTLSDISSKIDAIEELQGEDRARYARSRIVRFNDELLNNARHSKSMFDSILLDCTTYEQYCDTHKEFRNGVATEAIENIKRCYRKCEVDKDFL